MSDTGWVSPTSNAGVDGWNWSNPTNAYTEDGSFTRGDYSSTGGGEAHNNLQPYIVVYFYKRTA